MTITEVYYLFFNSLGWITIVTTVIISTLLVESWSNLPHVGQDQEALADLNSSLRIQPNGVFALKHRGEAYLMLDRYQEALADLNKPLKIRPNDAWTLSRRVATYCMLKKYQETFADLNGQMMYLH